MVSGDMPISESGDDGELRVAGDMRQDDRGYDDDDMRSDDVARAMRVTGMECCGNGRSGGADNDAGGCDSDSSII